MTLTTTTSRNTYLGTGTTGPFAFTFRIFAATDLEVVTRDHLTNLETTLSYPGDFSVSGVGNGSGGSVTLTNVLPASDTVAIRRVRPLKQQSTFRNESQYLAANHEDAFDSLAMIDQGQQDQLDRSLTLSETYDPANYNLQLPAPAASKALVWNVAGTGFDNANLSAAQLSAWNAANNQKLDVFLVTVDFTAGVTTQLTLSAAPGSLTNLSVVRRTSGANVAYLSDEVSLSGQTLTFTSPIPANTTRVEVRYFYTYQINTVDSANASFNVAATGAVARTVSERLRERLSVLDFAGVVGDGSNDDTVGLQAALAGASALGQDLYFPDRDYKVTTMLTLTGSGIHLHLADGATINYSTPNYACLKITGARCSVSGGFGGGFVGPAVWDGTNTAATFGVIWITGDNTRICTRLVNVRKCGVWFRDVIDGDASGTYIEGNYPTGQWTGVETGHWGIYFDPPVSATAGNYKANGCTVKTCVQGVFAGNFGAGQVIQGFQVVGSIFESCWNHGVYNGAANGALVSGCSFNRCQVPIVMTGTHNSVTGCTLYTSVGAAGDERDVTGISMRNAQFCTVTGCTVKGVAVPSNHAMINFQSSDGTTPLLHNVCVGNTIDITDGECIAVRFEGGTQPVVHNVCDSNSIRCVGTPSEGAIEFSGPAGALNICNSAQGNNITLLGESMGVFALNMKGSTFSGNTVEYQFDLGAPTGVSTVALYDCSNCAADNNMSVCQPTFGANVIIIGYREFGTTGVNNSTSNNRNMVDTGGGATFANIQVIPGSDCYVNDHGLGITTLNCKRGSLWRRDDALAPFNVFSLYINQADGANWVAAD